MTNEIVNVPELRFPEFNEEWDINIFGDVVTNKSSKYTPKKTEALIDIELDSIESNTGRLIKNYTSNDFSSQKNVFKQHQVLYSKLRPYLNKYYFPNFDGVCTSEIWILDSKYSSTLSNEFLYYFIQTNKFKEVTNKSSGSKMPRADWNLVGNMRFNITSLKEQQKIGQFFSKLDRQIELGEQKLEKLEEQKKGYMQQIFSQKLRFKDDNGNYYAEWKEKNLGDISELITKGTTPKNKVNDGSINFIKVENISPINGFITNTTKITEEEHSTYLKRSQLKENDILFSIAGTLGRVSVVKREILPANTNQALAIIRLNAMNLEYIKTYLTGRAIKRFIANNPTVGAQPNMSLTQIRDLIIAIPNLTEQEKIGSFFKKIDNSIKKQSDKIWLLKKRKKGFLQKMFV